MKTERGKKKKKDLLAKAALIVSIANDIALIIIEIVNLLLKK